MRSTISCVEDTSYGALRLRVARVTKSGHAAEQGYFIVDGIGRGATTPATPWRSVNRAFGDRTPRYSVAAAAIGSATEAAVALARVALAEISLTDIALADVAGSRRWL